VLRFKSKDISKEDYRLNVYKLHINYDVDRFSFMLKGEIYDSDTYRKRYDLDWEAIIIEYLQVGIGDVPHFASQYVFGKALHERRTAEREEMQTMYLEIVAVINQMIEDGKLPLTI
jgi:hypothetical protein